MANLRDFTEDIGVQKATDARLGLVKGGGDTHINDDGQIEILSYNIVKLIYLFLYN